MKSSIYTAPKNMVDIPYEQMVRYNEAGLIYLENDIITYANKSFIELINEISNDVIGHSIYNFIKPKDRKKLEHGLEAMKKGTQSNFSDNLQMNLTDGQETYFSLHISIHKKTEDSIYLIGASRNSTSRVKKMEELTIAKSMYDALYDNIVDGLMIYDYNQERIIDCNTSALKIFGYENKDDLLKVNRFQFVPQYSKVFPDIDFHEETKDHGQRVMKGEAFKTPGIFVKNGGGHIIVHANVIPTFRSIGEAYIIFQDSTKRVLQKQAKLAAEKRYKQIYQNSHEGIIYTDLNTKERLMCNDKALQLFGVDTFEDLKKLKPQDFIKDDIINGLGPQEVFISKIKEAAKDGRAELSFWLKKQTGEIIRAIVVIMLDDSDPKYPKLISFVRDITNEYNSELKINEKNKELQSYIEANLQLENFAYFASHDLQTPLRGIISFTQLLRRSLRGKLSESEEEYMDFIIGSTKNMRNLVMDILSYSKVNSADINIEEVCLKDLLTELSQELREEINEKDAVVNFPNVPTIIQADAIKLKQLLQNLISNAVKFSTEDTKPIVEINCVEQEKQWLLSVQDNGIGIDPEFHDKIFMIFKRLHTKEKFEGTGIGLAMVKKIVDQHEGEIWVDSVAGKGTTFYFTIKKP